MGDINPEFFKNMLSGLQEQVNATKSELKTKEFVGESAAGAIVATVLGSRQVKSIHVDKDRLPENVKEEFSKIMELVCIAINNAFKKLEENSGDIIQNLSQDFNVADILKGFDGTNN